jgi:predicted membrane-bound spermidine synthase
MRRFLFAFFVVSGFTSLVYEVVWLRLAMASFGVTTPFVSIVLSVFMGGLALGSLAAGRLARGSTALPPARDLRLYALAEAVVGASSLSVPWALDYGRTLLERWQGGSSWGSGTYLAASGAWIGLVMLPACVCMGATFPLAMAAIRKWSGPSTSFSRLYLANVLGATTGTLLSAFVLVETFGFRGTLILAAGLNAAIVITALVLAARTGRDARAPRFEERATSVEAARPGSASLALLFGTGLLSMAMEIVWVRQLTPFLGTFVYGFALILAIYLAATFIGSAVYRARLRLGVPGSGNVGWAISGALALLSLLAGDPYAPLPWGLPQAILRPCLGIAPIAAAFGYLTPMLVDRASDGEPERAGRAYAVNVLGCILGPLLACFVLLPLLGERGTAIVLAAPLFAIAFASAAGVFGSTSGERKAPSRTALAAGVVVAIPLVLGTHAYEAGFTDYEIRRDATATVIAVGEGLQKELFVNGVSVTGLTPITKVMVHLPMAWRRDTPRDVLIVCFGMGTSFRSALSWDVPTTAVELAPGVADVFEYFHADAQQYRRRPGARIVVDDGRRFLERTSMSFDLIVIDPPPPVEAAASSLLYSREFYRIAKKRMRPRGILQQWFPGGGDPETLASIIGALQAEFPFVRGFQFAEGTGMHLLASDAPLEDVPARELAARMPEAAAKDLVEWGPESSPELQLGRVLSREISLDLSEIAPGVPPMTDDRPVNEYFLLRRLRAGSGG